MESGNTYGLGVLLHFLDGGGLLGGSGCGIGGGGLDDLGLLLGGLLLEMVSGSLDESSNG